MWEWLILQLKTNQFLSGAIGGSISFAFFNYFKSWFTWLLSILKDWFVREITISQADNYAFYNEWAEYLTAFIKHPKNVKVEKLSSSDKNLSPKIGYGTHWFWHNWYTFVRISLSRDENNHSSNKTETITIYFLGLSPRKQRQKFIDEMIAKHKLKNGENNIWTKYGNLMELKGKVKYRDLSTLFLTEDNKNDLDKVIKRIEYVFSDDNIYQKIGATRKVGLFLHGPPGCGKSTIIQCLSSYFKIDICHVNANNEGVVPSFASSDSSIIVLEDVDCLDIATRDNGPVFSKFLQMLDGVGVPDKSIIIATTNCPDKIDPAFKRHGRFDCEIKIDPANREVAEKMVEFFDPTKKDILDTLEYPCPQATIQKLLLE